jgi:hypothetical protein
MAVPWGMTEPSSKQFVELTLGEVLERATDEPYEVMPGLGRKVYGPWARLARDMWENHASTVGELPGPLRDRHWFSLRLQHPTFRLSEIEPED